ncbi:MAG: ABC transporter substrate-binding protein [Pseudomonadota bacterium]
MRLAFMLVVLAVIALPARAELPVIRIAVLKFGTVNWLTETIRQRGLDAAEGYRLEVVPLAGKAATTIAFKANDVDLIVSDWVWALRQREQAGADLRFSPYSSALGALVARPDAGVDGLCDLAGRSLGVVGGDLDKSWLILQAVAQNQCDVSLTAETSTLFGAPPLMSRQLETGAVDAVSTYWHYASRLEAAGNRRLVDIAEAIEGLGIAPAPPLVGFVWDASRDLPGMAGFLRSVQAAGVVLAENDAQWDRLRPLMRVANTAEFNGLRRDYRAGIPEPWQAKDTAAAAELHALLIEMGGPALAAQTGRFDPEVFATPATARRNGG